MKILVTGCAGFIGSHSCEKLLQEGHRVLGIDNLDDYYCVEMKKNNIELLSKYSGFTFRKDEVQTTTAVGDFRPDRILHLASMAGVRASIAQPLKYVDVNVTGMVKLLQDCTKYKIPHMVYASSSSVYGKSTKIPFKEKESPNHVVSPYAASKKSMEIFANTHSYLHGLSCIGLRFFTVYGPRGRPDMAPSKFLRAIASGKKFQKFGTGSSRDYTYVDDIVRGILGALERVRPGVHRVYNLGNSSRITLEEFIETCEEVVGKKAVYEVIDRHPADVPHTCADIARAQEELGYKPRVNLREGLTHAYAEFVRAQSSRP